MYAFRISHPDGLDLDLEVIDLPGGQDACYAQLRELVGGPLERVVLSPGAVAIVNEEGAGVLPRNPAATLFVVTAVSEDGRQLVGEIHGTAIVIGEVDGCWAPITVRELNRALALASVIARG